MISNHAKIITTKYLCLCKNVFSISTTAKVKYNPQTHTHTLPVVLTSQNWFLLFPVYYYQLHLAFWQDNFGQLHNARFELFPRLQLGVCVCVCVCVCIPGWSVVTSLSDHSKLNLFPSVTESIKFSKYKETYLCFLKPSWRCF